MKNIEFYKITVVTPNFNQANFLEKTILSVLSQNYPNLEYIIIDGGSTDGSVEIIKNYEKYLFHWESEKDNGMYHAINKGFRKSTGDILCWINSDDILWQNSLFKVNEAFKNPDVHWIQGFPTVIDINDNLIYERKHIYSPFFFYLNNHLNSFNFIQQESTFWSRDLWKRTGGKLSSEYKIAADFDLWMRFFNHSDLYCIDDRLGAFRIRSEQKSANRKLYFQEAKRSLEKNFKNLNFPRKIHVKLLLFLKNIKNRTNSTFLKRIYHALEKHLIGQPKILSHGQA